MNLPMAVQASARDRPGTIAGFDPLHPLRAFGEQSPQVRSREAQLAKLGRGYSRHLMFLDGDITAVGGHDQYSHGNPPLGLQLVAKNRLTSLRSNPCEVFSPLKFGAVCYFRAGPTASAEANCDVLRNLIGQDQQLMGLRTVAPSQTWSVLLSLNQNKSAMPRIAGPLLRVRSLWPMRLPIHKLAPHPQLRSRTKALNRLRPTKRNRPHPMTFAVH